MLATAPFAYHGRYLRVDLSRQHAEWIEIPERVLRAYIGGSGLGTHLLAREKGHCYDALAPESVSVIAFSPLVGSALTTSAKFAVVARSPLTNRLNDSLVSSGFAINGKRLGADAIVIRGKAAMPTVLVIDNGECRFDSAHEVWGQSCSQTENTLRARLGADYRLATIGLAGENQVRYATISHDGRHAGRGGHGAVWGSKNLKAVAVRGNSRPEWAQPKQLHEYAKGLSEKSFGPATAKYRELGTATNLLVFNRLNALPTRNFQQGSFAGATAIAPETLEFAREKSRASCAACTIGCEHLYSLQSKSGKQGDKVRVEYENLFALGPLCGVDDSEMVLRASQRCDTLGLDTISAGGTIAFAMECVERGILDAPWLKFGSGQAVLDALDLIARREGIGAQLADGSRRFAQHLGQGTIDFAPQVKGLEIPGYEPRALQTMAVGLAVNARGADHNRSGAYEADFSVGADRRQISAETAQNAIETEDRAALIDSLILCKFIRGVFADLYDESATMLHMLTGWDVDESELRQAAKRIIDTKKWFNVACGWQPEEDCLPKRFLDSALPEDQAATIDRQAFTAAIKSYNQQRGWSESGFLSQQTRQQLAEFCPPE